MRGAGGARVQVLTQWLFFLGFISAFLFVATFVSFLIATFLIATFFVATAEKIVFFLFE